MLRRDIMLRIMAGANLCRGGHGLLYSGICKWCEAGVFNLLVTFGGSYGGGDAAGV